MISRKGFIALRTFSVQKMSYCSKEFLESIFLNLVKVQKLDVTNKCYLAQKKAVLFNYIFLSGELPYVSFLPGKLLFPGESPLTRILL